ncbi:Phosphatidylethanolamine N-methyltransferase [Porphyridium purpureum]|uniref:Phosphatidylethanolamine N-methyltransferase n=1 Tax=Porphyridium purpureum TaxID=35688 RepID=A0A5J4Z852_PORPP|nr:Phosphatidylethanolamine N-methyltransferase [Porphyridium purpureum]|eukprot:POR8719..scf295_1
MVRRCIAFTRTNMFVGVYCGPQPRERCVSRRAVVSAAAAVAVGTVLGPETVCARRANTQAEYDDASTKYDALDDGPAAQALQFPQMRAVLLARAKGRVLELGVGTGLNLPYYAFGTGHVTNLTGADLSQGMLAQAAMRARALGLNADGKVEFVQADATDMSPVIGSNSFDTIVETFALCVMSDPGAVLREAHRIIRKSDDSRLLILDHTRSSWPLLGTYQDITEPAVTRLSKQCRWNLRIPDLLRENGWSIVAIQSALAGTVVTIEARPSL